MIGSGADHSENFYYRRPSGLQWYKGERPPEEIPGCDERLTSQEAGPILLVGSEQNHCFV